mmetsp:Transcript_102977/g.259502  ORF Transcript_102977/g.259502 Transcript_102977/m.259502 type:complete len:218 (+) Transcript_102977:176-829(+)
MQCRQRRGYWTNWAGPSSPLLPLPHSLAAVAPRGNPNQPLRGLARPSWPRHQLRPAAQSHPLAPLQSKLQQLPRHRLRRRGRSSGAAVDQRRRHRCYQGCPRRPSAAPQRSRAAAPSSRSSAWRRAPARRRRRPRLAASGGARSTSPPRPSTPPSKRNRPPRALLRLQPPPFPGPPHPPRALQASPPRCARHPPSRARRALQRGLDSKRPKRESRGR